MKAFNPIETTISEVHKAMQDGQVSCRELTEFYLEQIARLDQRGPRLNAIIEINPDALKEADELDRRFRECGLTGPLHGIPVLLKDNIQTAGLNTTAGSLSLKDFKPIEDAFIVKRLKAAGALVLAKTNLHEFAIWGETISSVLGQTLNPYDLTRTPGGSSGGTAAAVASNMGLIGIGTDTVNSVRSPASACCLVGIRPTMGLVSRSGIIPCSLTQDTAGPICRSVEDAVRTLDCIAVYDGTDAVTARGFRKHPASYTDSLKKDGIKGKRLGVLKSFFGSEPCNEAVNEIMRSALSKLEACGATIIYIEEIIDSQYLTDKVNVNMDDFKADLDAYLASLGGEVPMHSMAEIIASGKYHPGIEANLKRAMSLAVGTPGYNEKLICQDALKTRLLKLMADYNLDALVFPHQQQLVCKVGGAQKQRNGVLCAVTGFPSIVVPAGFAADENAPIGVPVGMEFVGRPFDEPVLIELAYGFEQAAQVRRPPEFTIV